MVRNATTFRDGRNEMLTTTTIDLGDEPCPCDPCDCPGCPCGG
jgi:hypothetical protein